MYKYRSLTAALIVLSLFACIAWPNEYVVGVCDSGDVIQIPIHEVFLSTKGDSELDSNIKKQVPSSINVIQTFAVNGKFNNNFWLAYVGQPTDVPNDYDNDLFEAHCIIVEDGINKELKLYSETFGTNSSGLKVSEWIESALSYYRSNNLKMEKSIPIYYRRLDKNIHLTVHMIELNVNQVAIISQLSMKIGKNLVFLYVYGQYKALDDFNELLSVVGSWGANIVAANNEEVFTETPEDMR